MAMNTYPLHHLLVPREGHTRQSSSFGKDPDRGGTWWGLRPAPARRKRILLEPGETHTLAALDGAGIITSLWFTTLLPVNPHALRSLVLRFYWDGESQPSVECPFGDFFGVPFGRYVSYIAEPMSVTSGGFNCRWPMPYAASARLKISNEGTAVVDPLYYHVVYDELDVPLDTELRFHAEWHRENPTPRGKTFTLLDARGRGHYVGCHLFMQNREWWLRLPLGDIVLPYGFGIGMLEGWETIVVDGEQKPSAIGTGTEDYFGGSFYYYQSKGFFGPHHGCTLRDYVRGRIAAYRFDIPAPVPFRRSLRVTMDHGFENQLECDYTRVAYWYQDEPHRPFPPLPSPSARRPTSPILNVMQAALAASVPSLVGLALARRLWKAVRRQ